MKKKTNKLLLAFILLCGILSPLQNAYGLQEIKETNMLSGFLGDNFTYIKQILRYAQEMQHQARPFTVRRHRERFRFEPSDKYPREIMILSRKMIARFKMINGLIYHADIPNKNLLFQQTADTIDSIVVFSKRSIRAVKDNNYALYLASAQGIEKEVFAVNELLNTLERSINANIEETDALRESL